MFSPLNKIIKFWNRIQEIGPFTSKIWPLMNEEIISIKKILSKILGVNKKNIALTENISTGMILPLWGIRFKQNDELLIGDCEHPGIVAACREICRRNEIKFIIIPIGPIVSSRCNNSISIIIILTHLIIVRFNNITITICYLNKNRI